ncbi:hypothetical protein LINGRAHAP2_LOCUS31093 [Linum grandiflorum]
MCDFWSNFWVRGVRFSSCYPRIADVAQSLARTVFNLRTWQDGRTWLIPVWFVLRGGALEEWYLFLQHLNSLPKVHITAGPASVVWALKTSGRFTVKSLRSAISVHHFPRFDFFPFEIIWVHLVPTKIQCFAWMVLHKKIATTDNLQRRGFYSGGGGRCALCSINGESVDHLFIQCKYSVEIWSRLSLVLSLHGPFHHNVAGFLVTSRPVFLGILRIVD